MNYEETHVDDGNLTSDKISGTMYGLKQPNLAGK